MILGISGRARSGKDTLAGLFITDFNFVKISFADSLKEVCSSVFSIDLNIFHDNELKDKPFEEPIIFNANHAELLFKCLENEGIITTDEQKQTLIAHALDFKFTSPRDLLQRVGTDLCRNFINDSVWINIFENRVSKKEGFYVCADVRFKNEREAIHKLGGKNLLILRPNLPEITHNSHESELLGCDSYEIDVTVINDSTIHKLKDEVKSWWYDKLKTMRLI
jgi:hypothetical protein